MVVFLYSFLQIGHSRVWPALWSLQSFSQVLQNGTCLHLSMSMHLGFSMQQTQRRISRSSSWVFESISMTVSFFLEPAAEGSSDSSPFFASLALDSCTEDCGVASDSSSKSLRGALAKASWSLCSFCTAYLALFRLTSSKSSSSLISSASSIPWSSTLKSSSSGFSRFNAICFWGWICGSLPFRMKLSWARFPSCDGTFDPAY